MLAASAEQYRRQQRITALALRQTRRFQLRGPAAIAQLILIYQAEAISLSLEYAEPILAEQGIATTQESTVVAPALLGSGAVTTSMLDQVDTDAAFDRLVGSLVLNGSRTASVVDAATRPAVTGYVRYLNPPSCSRCAILAGRVYRHSTGFRRHPLCDCLMQPSNQEVGPELVTDPQVAFERGQIRDLSAADTKAVELGADLGRVVNVRRQEAGLRVQSSVLTRRGALTPEGILRRAGSDEEAVTLLRKAGYIR